MSDSWPRRRLLAILRGASEPLDAQELARVTGQHVTTVRFHLDVLTRESLVRQFQQPPRGRGRPRIGYTAVQRSVGYQDLAQVLADQLGSDPRRRSDAAVAAGRAWGAKLDTVDKPISSLDEAKEVTVTVMSELGFAPERDPSSETEEQALIRLTACPLRDLARTHSEVVCGVHLGLMRELLDRNGARDAVNVRLHPFVEPELCVARLEALRSTLVPDPNTMPDAPPEAAEPRLSAPSGSRIAPQLRSDPQLRNTDAHVAQQSTQ
ncbi:transcriptional regulator [Nocardia terpenica]|uniref:Transcriptional regulator n=1 Tax=Nocardia terpenica TaxID=455432 RepID=A0A291REC2_9NOCA|nr:transcriptional regulator [Nocardia terpenica]ATL65923.1 transcriptional regulator [Nocardia terpenica]MBF6061879.1 transcriptional regulator [Nocardia terpenica]MBF6106320.1 transcriptional regulator [Nocardia terpenica]MBF6110299.1 transcriptional regulator [Nocardia terpenica]MBF6120864.1 transcriptional regulator [Nocardia terpenica]